MGGNLHILENILKVMGNEKRLAILKLLMEEKEMSLQAISYRLNLPLKTASRNLNLLKSSGFLIGRTRRAQAIYQINIDSSNFFTVVLLAALRVSCNYESKKRTRYEVDQLLAQSFASIVENFNRIVENQNN